MHQTEKQIASQPTPSSSARSQRDFVLLLTLFVAFRAMTLVAFRPGGQVLDYSDFYYYREVAQLSRQGYMPYVNLWAPYPPLFPWLMIGVWRLSQLLPPWEFPNLWFSLLLGGVLLIFETGNLALIYLISRRWKDHQGALRSAGFYALLFTPVYILSGWFDGLPIFFFLLSLYLLLRGRLLWSALTTGIGFMIKFIPVTLLPIGAHISGVRDQTSQAKGQQRVTRGRLEVRVFNLSFDIRRLVLYAGTFGLTVIIIGLPFYLLNPRLVWGSLAINGARAPWESVWALLEGEFGYGIAPLDMRNTAWDATSLPGSSLPWLWITAAFGVVYVLAYTRRINWREPRRVVAFTGFTVILFLLYSKGYSPQWLGWALVFIAMLLPDLRGAFYAVVTGLLNLIEANIFFTIVPDEHWILIVTVGLRSLILLLLAVEFLLIARPRWLTTAVHHARRWAVIGLGTLLVLGSVPASVRFVQAYFDVRYQLSPYQATIEALRSGHSSSGQGAGEPAMVLNSYDHHTYDWLYPYLRQMYTFYMLDDYAPPGESVEARTLAQLERITAAHRDWWLFDNDPSTQSPSEAVAAGWLSAHGKLLDARDMDGGRLYHFQITP